MNYRHAYHAGNFADCFKHALLLLLIEAMQRKDKPYLALDTHAGAGGYDLSAGPAEQTGEWRQGVGRLLEARPAALASYLGLIERLGLYPGSPRILAALARPGDRLIACELHPNEALTLKRELAAFPSAAVHARDGYEAMRAFLPPPEKRGLILIDPPYERTDEFTRLAAALNLAARKFINGVYASWYPIKHRAPVRAFLAQIKETGLRDVIACELLLREPVNPARLNGCGLLVVNPPYGFEAGAWPILRALRDCLGEAGSEARIERVIDE